MSTTNAASNDEEQKTDEIEKPAVPVLYNATEAAASVFDTVPLLIILLCFFVPLNSVATGLQVLAWSPIKPGISMVRV